MTEPVVFLCTGNAARSVMGGAALAAHLPDWHVTTAGTLVVEGQPMSWRTKAALDAVGLAAPHHPRRRAAHGHPPTPGTRPARPRRPARRPGGLAGPGEGRARLLGG